MPSPLELVASLDFGTLAFVGGSLFVAAIWTFLPFSLFGVRGRLDMIEEAKRAQTEMLVVELRQMHASLTGALRSR